LKSEKIIASWDKVTPDSASFERIKASVLSGQSVRQKSEHKTPEKATEVQQTFSPVAQTGERSRFRWGKVVACAVGIAALLICVPFVIGVIYGGDGNNMRFTAGSPEDDWREEGASAHPQVVEVDLIQELFRAFPSGWRGTFKELDWPYRSGQLLMGVGTHTANEGGSHVELHVNIPVSAGSTIHIGALEFPEGFSWAVGFEFMDARGEMFAIRSSELDWGPGRDAEWGDFYNVAWGDFDSTFRNGSFSLDDFGDNFSWRLMNAPDLSRLTITQIRIWSNMPVGEWFAIDEFRVVAPQSEPSLRDDFVVAHDLLPMIWGEGAPGFFEFAILDSYPPQLHLSTNRDLGINGTHLTLWPDIVLDMKNEYYIYLSGGLGTMSNAAWSVGLDVVDEGGNIMTVRAHDFVEWEQLSDEWGRFDRNFNHGRFNLNDAIRQIASWSFDGEATFAMLENSRLTITEVRIWSNLTTNEGLVIGDFFIGTRHMVNFPEVTRVPGEVVSPREPMYTHPPTETPLVMPEPMPAEYTPPILVHPTPPQPTPWRELNAKETFVRVEDVIERDDGQRVYLVREFASDGLFGGRAHWMPPSVVWRDAPSAGAAPINPELRLRPGMNVILRLVSETFGVTYGPPPNTVAGEFAFFAPYDFR